jgi:hypothetical protein
MISRLTSSIPENTNEADRGFEKRAWGLDRNQYLKECCGYLSALVLAEQTN